MFRSRENFSDVVSEADNESAELGVIAAEAAGWHDAHFGVAPFFTHGGGEHFCALAVVAMADEDGFGDAGALFDVVDDGGDGFLFAAGFAFDLYGPFFCADADAPEAELAGEKAGVFVHAAVFDEVVEGAQGEGDVGVLLHAAGGGDDVVKFHAGVDELVDVLDDEDELWSGGAGIDDGDVFLWIFFGDHLLGDFGAVVAAGKIAGDGDGDGILGFFKLFKPGVWRWAGGLAGVFAELHGCDEFAGVEFFVVDEFDVAYVDVKRYGAEADAVVLQLVVKHVAAGICDDVPLHDGSPFFRNSRLYFFRMVSGSSVVAVQHHCHILNFLF